MLRYLIPCLLLTFSQASATTTAFTRFSSFFGGSSQDSVSRVLAAPDGRLVIIGYTFSDDLPVTMRSGPGGDTDVVVSVFSSQGRQLLFSHRIGGGNSDLARDLALDSDGNIYVAGETDSFDFPVMAAIQAFNPGNPSVIDANDREAFVLKLDGRSGELLWSSYFGGSGYDAAHGLAVDDGGRVYLAGETLSRDFPVTPGALDHDCGSDGLCNDGGFDGFVAVLQPGLAQPLLWSSYLGGGDSDKLHALALTPDGLIVVAGETRSSDLPVRQGPYQTPFGDTDAFVLVLDWHRPGPGSLILGSYLGGSDEDLATVVRIAADGTIVIGGDTRSNNFPVLGAWYGNRDGNGDLFISRIAPGNGQLLASSRLGGGLEDSLADLRIAADGGLWFAGNTRSRDFPLWSAGQLQLRGTQDGVIGRFNRQLSSLLLSSYYGGSAEDSIAGLALINDEEFVIAGDSESLSLPGNGSGWQLSLRGQSDMFFTGLQSGPAGTGAPLRVDKPARKAGALSPLLIFVIVLLYTGVLMFRVRDLQYDSTSHN